MDETIQKNLIHDFVAEVEQKVVNNSIVPEDFKTALYQLKEAKLKIQGLLELLQANDAEMNKIYRQIANENYVDLIDDLNSLGYRYRKQNKNLKDAFEKMGYRIMEQTRSGRREDVFYSFLRIYISVNTPFDRKLLSAFKQSDDGMFKVLIFSFLSGIIEDKTNSEE